jgi:hypothetical protein
MIDFGDLISTMYSLKSLDYRIQGDLETAQTEKQYVESAMKTIGEELGSAISKYLLGSEKEPPKIIQWYTMLKAIEKEEKLSGGVRNFLKKKYQVLLRGLRPLVEYFNSSYIPAEEKALQEDKKSIPEKEKRIAQMKKIGKEYLRYIQ